MLQSSDTDKVALWIEKLLDISVADSNRARRREQGHRRQASMPAARAAVACFLLCLCSTAGGHRFRTDRLLQENSSDTTMLLSNRKARPTNRTRRAACCLSGGGAANPGGWELPQTGNKTAWLRDNVHLVLVHPLIPQNTGTIARTCAATGLDYWEHVAVCVHADWDEFAEYFDEQPMPRRLVGFSKRGKVHYATPGLYTPGDWLLFGAETTGLPAEAVAACEAGGGLLRIPIDERHVRSLNLGVSAGVGLFEALRQLDGPHS
ncbi:hypothetical protein WJX81_008379 [Elliptochloris bilobata]|uniref:tRNA/rRNA methyltransferase SpoU type domain-containing protein n=1 Tax=Elliptochloris bilobata TaxID=381761 RepID=A0AAW1QXF8_9CHLO